MKDNYDFSNAERGKFYRKDATLKNRKPAVDELAETRDLRPGEIQHAGRFLILPKILKPLRTELRVPHGVRDVPVSEVLLD